MGAMPEDMAIPAFETEPMSPSGKPKKPAYTIEALRHRYCRYIILAVLCVALVLVILTVSLLIAYVWFRDSQDSSEFPPGILLLGGIGSPTDTEFYDPMESRQTINISRPFLISRKYLAVVAVGGCIYAIGGQGDEGILRSTEILCGLDQTWRPGPSMNTARKGPAVSVVNGHIYVCGGDGGFAERLRSCEFLDPEEGEWTNTTSMQGNRDDAPAVTVNGYYYVIGGFNKTHKQLNTTERYDPVNKSWSYMAELLQRREHHAAAALEPYIYTCGGYLADRPYGFLRSCERYDSHNDTWSFIAPLHRERDDFAMTSFQGKLYVIGGENVEVERTVEVYDPTRNRWIFAPDLATPRRFHAVVPV